MAISSSILIEQAVALPRVEQEEVVRRLTRHLYETSPSTDEQIAIDARWRAEYANRLEDAEAHPEDDVDGDIIRAELKAFVEQHRRDAK